MKAAGSGATAKRFSSTLSKRKPSVFDYRTFPPMKNAVDSVSQRVFRTMDMGTARITIR